MKKSVLLVIILLLVIAVLPFIGNAFLKAVIDKELSKLDTSEFVILKDETDTSYLSTSRHLKVKVIQGTYDTLVGVDIKYNNLPFTKALQLDVYPLSLPSEIDENMKKSYPLFYKELTQFIETKSFIYHVKYNLIDHKFDATIGDIDHQFHLENNASLQLIVNKAKSYGHLQDDFVPDSVNSKIGTFVLKMSDEKNRVDITLHKFLQTSSFTTKNGKINSDSSVSIKELSILSRKLSFNVKDMSMQTTIEDIDAKIYSEFSNFKSEAELRKLFIRLLSKGLLINLSEFRVKHIVLDDKKDLKGFDINMKVKVKKDELLANKIEISPLLALANVNFEVTFKMANELYTAMLKRGLSNPMLTKYLQQNKHDVSLDIKYVDGKIAVNGKQIQ